MLLSDALAQASLDVGDRFRDQPEVEAEIRLTLGIVLTKLAAYEDAQSHLEHAIRLFRELHPNGSEREAESLHARSLVYANGDRDYPEALRIGRESLAMFRRLVGDEDPRTQRVQGDLSWYQAGASGKYAPGLDNQYVLAVLAQGLNTGESPEEIQVRYLRLLPKVDRLWKEGQRDEAKSILRAEAEPFLQHERLRDYVPYSISSYAWMLYKEGVFTNTAMAMAVIAVELGNENLPVGHSKTLYAMAVLGRMYLDQQRFDEAESMFAPALEASRRTHGDDHPDTLVRLSDLAQLYFKDGRYAEAEPLLLEQYSRNEKKSGNNKKKLAPFMNNLIRLYEAWERPNKEKEWHDKLLLLTPTGK